ncbi:MAG: aspartate aminotransferase family protein [Candidatus Kerfeldbacteria bacterium]|nr:aspartate aminotransferase family protein [Candidatus Kerfeldbacteria bacterium]
MTPRSLTALEIAAGRSRFLVPAYLQYHPDCPVAVARANGAYVYDLEGREYVDAFAGVVTISVGHCDAEVLEAEIAQMRLAQHVTTLYHHEAPVLAAEALAATMTDMGDVQLLFTGTGTEATEFAVHLAKLHTGSSVVLSLRNSFHGRTLMSASLTAQEPWRNAGPYAVDTHHVAGPYAYREMPRGMDEAMYEAHLLAELERTIKHTGGGKLAALIVEPIQGNGGVLYGSNEFYGRLVEIVHRYGGLVIADEVQTGFGRTGKWWGSSHWPLPPDMRDMAKGMGNGNPVGGVAARVDVAAAFKGKAHFSTYGANPVAMRGVTKVVEIVGRAETQRNIQTRGEQLLTCLGELQQRHPLIGEVRGKGLMIGVELVRDRTTRAVAGTETLAVMDHCRTHGGVLLGKGGAGNVLRIKPPYCISADDINTIIRALDNALTTVESAG